MKDSFKIALGVFFGLFAAGLCAVCLFFMVSFGGFAYVVSLVESSPYATPTPPLFSLELTLVESIINSTLISPDFSLDPTSEITQTPVSGHIKQCDDLGIFIENYQISETCPNGSGQPAEGAKFIIVEIKVTNFTTDVISLPHIEFHLNDYESSLGSTSDCRYDDDAFGNVCWQSSGKLFPSVSCQGWELFEVPISFEPSSALFYASFQDYENNVLCDAQWPLEHP